jgi:hypothetical protein
MDGWHGRMRTKRYYLDLAGGMLPSDHTVPLSMVVGRANTGTSAETGTMAPTEQHA